jgi:23S rRNA pseudouridine1911/1915/1917 synthase
MPEPLTVQKSAPLLEYLFESWPEVKKKQVRTWLKFQSIQVNGRVVSQFDHKLKSGDVISVRGDRNALPGTRLPKGLLIRYEDDSVIVIEKPERLLTIANEKVQDNTAYAYLTSYMRHGDRFSHNRIWIVHRLDRDTSGLMVFAKTETAKRILQRNWDQCEKRYFAVVEGGLPKPKGTFRSYLDESNPAKVHVVASAKEGRLAITHYKIVKKVERFSLVELTLETGRRHQIRVQLAEAGCPIVGDSKYRAQSNPIRRVALHSCYLRFVHPLTEKVIKFESPLPGDFGRLLTSHAARTPLPPRIEEKDDFDSEN